MNGSVRAAALAAICVLLAGCSETGFQDLFGAGKYTPDETQVHQNQSLSMPPDLQLRPPSNEAAPQPQQQAYVPPPQQPPLDQAPTYQEPATANQQAYTPPPAQQPVAQQPVAQQPPQDVYARMGISRTRPDGTQKTQAELTEEMRQKKMADEKAKNPNYGTIWNMGNVFSE
jgi:hypothetical protein